MDFPVFHLDFIGNRLLIAVIAVIHVCINHPLAVGAMPLVTAMEWWGHRKRSETWDRLAFRVLMVCFVITTTFGALTGVGIWLSTSLVNPYAIGSLIRVFFWAWFAEWIVFVIEVMAIMVYFLTWKRMAERKAAHIAIGVALSLASWVTMAIITAILGFMMNPGSWTSDGSFLSGVFNPIYLPQLAFRTPLAMLTAGLFGLFLAYFFTSRDPALRRAATRFISLWTLCWTPVLLAGAMWYWNVVPGWMVDNVPVALATQSFVSWHDSLLASLIAVVAVVLVTSTLGVLRPGWLPRGALLVPFVLALVLLGTFERVREFIRKPYVIGTYMYANGLRAGDLPLFKEDGILAHATYVSTRTITPETRLQAGRDVFRIACTRCHTTSGVNSVTRRIEDMYGPGDWDRDALKGYVTTMHTVRPYMPPFPGNDQEAGALSDYLLALRSDPRALEGDQSIGIAQPLAVPASAGAPAAAAGS